MTHMTHGRNRPPAPWPTRTQPPNRRATQDEMPRRGQGAAIATRDDERNLSSGISYILLRVLLMTKFRRNRTAVLKTRLNVVTMHCLQCSSRRHRRWPAAGGRGGRRARARPRAQRDAPGAADRSRPRRGRRASHGAAADRRPAARHRHSGRRAPRLTLLPLPVKFTRALLASAFLWLTHNTRAGNLISDLV